MRNNVRVLAFSIILAAGVAGKSTAATLGLSIEKPIIQSNSISVNYVEFAGDGDLSIFGAEVDFSDGVSPVGVTELSLGMGFSLANPTAGATGGFNVFDENGLFLDGDLFRVGFMENMIELNFNNLGGSAASAFGDSVLASIVFDNVLGPNPFASLVDGNSYIGSIEIARVANSVAIPEPGVLSLILVSLVGIWNVRRKNTAKAIHSSIGK